METKSKPDRVPRACDRCRRQKLKCDIQRPCTLCVRSHVACLATKNTVPLTSVPVTIGKSKKRRLDKSQAESSTGLVVSPQVPSKGCGVDVGANFISSGESSDLELLHSDTGQTQDQGKSPNLLQSSTFDEPRHRNGARLSTGSVKATSENRPSSHDVFGSDSSAMGLTTKVFKFNESYQVSTTSALPGGAPLSSPCQFDSVFLEVLLPPDPVVEALVDSYFDTVHWFMFILHEPSFRSRTKQILSLGSQMNSPEDADFAALLLMVIALGAQYAGTNPESRLKSLMTEFSIDLESLVAGLIRQVRSHLLDSLEHCQIEAVQTCVLLGTYYIYHGNPNLSWSVLGLAVKTAYALGMHRETEWKGDKRLLQARKRTWGHTYIADTFAAVIFGRPSTVDRTFCDVSYPDEFDDTEILMPLGTYLTTLNNGHPITKLSYHSCKYVLYDIKAQIISKIYTLRARASFQASSGGVQKLVKVVQVFDKKLKTWHDQIPPFFKMSKWASGDGLPSDVFNDLHEALPAYQERIKEHLIMQTIALQLLYDYILILLHRPLLEYRMSSQKTKKQPSAAIDPFPNSFEVCINAALRISYAPASRFKYHCPMALITMHMFTAGVILCMPATMDPFSALAHKTKGGVVRMIRSFKKLSSQSPVVAQSCTILEELMKVVLKRELELILRPEKQDDADGFDVGNQVDLPSIAANQIPASHPSSLESHIESIQAPVQADNHQNTLLQAENSAVPASSAPINGTRTDTFQGLQTGHFDSTASPEGLINAQSYDFIDAEPDVGFTDAFGTLEKVIYHFAPSEWMNPAWMHSYESAELYSFPQSGFADIGPQNSSLSDVDMSNFYEMGQYNLRN